MTTSKPSWWSHATTEQKLAQIDGAIECRLAPKHVAMNCGAENADIVYSFAYYNGRKFGKSYSKSATELPMNSVRLARKSAERWHRDPSDSEVSRLFPIRPEKGIFEPRFDD